MLVRDRGRSLWNCSRLNTLRENKIMVVTKSDGVYIRMAGNVNKGECFSDTFAKVKSF